MVPVFANHFLSRLQERLIRTWYHYSLSVGPEADVSEVRLARFVQGIGYEAAELAVLPEGLPPLLTKNKTVYYIMHQFK